MIRNFFSILVILVTMTTTAMAQQPHKKDPYKREWEQIDSLMGKGLPQSAAKIARQLLAAAQQKKDDANVIKAQLFLMGIDDSIHENADVQNMLRIDSIIASSQGAEKALWQSINAELYWQYFQRNRWQLYNRTPIVGQPPVDIATWDAAALIAKASELYQASISDSEPLKAIPVEHYTPILIEGKNTRHLRPTLYDFLAFRAIAFFENDEKDVIRPAYQFQIDDALWFESAKKFSEVNVKPTDPDALHFKALRTYQQVLAFHLNDEKPDALIDADLQRLAFVYQYSVHPDKDSLYLNALRTLEARFNGTPAVAEVSYRIIAFEYGATGYTSAQDKPQRHVPSLRLRLTQLIDAYPDTEGAANATILLRQIDEKHLQIITESVNIPDAHIKALVTYKNLANIQLHLYLTPADLRDIQQYHRDSIITNLLTNDPVRKWEQQLPASEDMELHRTEIKVDALPSGNYVLVASTHPNLQESANILHLVQFQVSNISMISNNVPSGKLWYALHRKSGKPLAGAKIVFWERSWDYSNRQGYTLEQSAVYKTDKEGKLFLSNKALDRLDADFDELSISLGGDSLYIGDYYDHYYYYDDEEEEDIDEHTFFFTDRSIYRPGQTIYFKGIRINSKKNGKQNNVVPNEHATVDFYDANGQVVSSLTLKTNAYGSFEGKFTAPEHSLTGRMRIADKHGSTYLSVEEYKRPRFYVEFDTIKGNYALHETVSIKGHAHAYSGNTIDGATVKYRVVRRARFPYFWTFYRWGQPRSPEMEIANGTAQTGTDGSFSINFETIPDRQINPETLPIFTYTVYADVTDINGETRSGNQQLHAGYQSMQIISSIGNVITGREQLVTAYTQNLNSVFTPTQLELTVSPLQFPGKIYRQRLWEKPDQYALTEQEFRTAFPDDEYRDEANYLNWGKEKSTFQTLFNTSPDGKVTIPESAWTHEGWYVLEFTGKDPQGNSIIEKKYTYLAKLEEKSLPQGALFIHKDKSSYEPGDTLKLSVKTGFADAYLLENHTLSKNALPKPVSPYYRSERTITNDNRGGIGYQWIYVYNNRVYTAQEYIPVPWSDRNLQLEWGTHRDKLLPGDGETWTVTVKGHKKDQVAAELLTGMYDASLDAFIPHQWGWDALFPANHLRSFWLTNYGFGNQYGFTWRNGLINHQEIGYTKYYDRLYFPGGRNEWAPMLSGRVAGVAVQRNLSVPVAVETAASGILGDSSAALEEVVVNGYNKADTEEGAFSDNLPAVNEPFEVQHTVPVRTNLQETAFFFPQLRTDAEGNVTFTFTIPEALTEWRMMAFAHTKDWKTGYLEGKVKTQKDLMVMPNLPRFLRQGDRIHISTKISNLAEQALQGVARLEILDATTLTPITNAFGNNEHEVAFNVEQGQSTAVDWPIQIPDAHYEPVVIRISAKAGDFTDGEENTLPVITNRMLVTETLPLPVRGNESHTFTLPKLLNPASETLTHHALTVEFTGNPAWYAVQALPYLMEYPYECAEQVFNRYYSTALAAHIVAQAPNVKTIFDRWLESDTTALLSNLDKNQELKSALLEETPWVMEAKSESEQKRRIALLFDSHKLAQGLQQNLTKLAEMQRSDGSFPWFRGMNGNRYITQYIATGIARLQQLGIEAAQSSTANGLLQKAVGFLDRQIKADHDALLKSEARMQDQHILQTHIQYLYMRSFFGDTAIPKESQTAYQYYTAQATNYWPKFNTYLKGLIALALHRGGDKQTPAEIIASLRETATQNPEMGMYWKSMPHGYWWYEAPIEAQALLIEAFAEIAKDPEAVDALKVWLLKQKQTQHWKTTKATADAIYALLLQGSDWLASEPVANITLGNETIRSTDIDTEAGTGYFKKRFDSEAVSTDMGNITVKLDKATNDGVAWGAVYWQYFENLDNITSTETPLSLRKQLYIERNTDRGPVLTEITATNMPKVGDKVKVRIELRVDRDMEYVHLKDMRATCFEPINVLSGYRYQGGLGYYESTRDVATNFFFDYLRRGTYVFEYPVFVSQSGDFSNGIATIQSMYAPEFSSHSEGIRVKVE